MDVLEYKLSRKREKMVALFRSRGIRPGALLEAFAQLPRERFVLGEDVEDAYVDRPLPIGHGQTISQPYVVAFMIQELGVEPHHRVLDIGTGSGYQTAILARLAKEVYAMERIEDLAERATAALAGLEFTNVTILTGDGSLGWPEEAPFDRIISGAAGPEIPAPWIDQLADGGRIVAPVGAPDSQHLVLVSKDGAVIRRDELLDVRFVKLIGRNAFPEER